MWRVRALVQKLFRSAKPEKLENHHSFKEAEVFLVVVVVTASTVAAIVASAGTRIVFMRIALTGPLQKRRGNFKAGGVV